MNINAKHKYLEVDDFSVSKETFTLYLDDEYQLLKTEPTPSLDVLDSYYESPNYISHTDSKSTFFDKVYQSVKIRAIQNKFSIIEEIQKVNGTLLDIGCGTGEFLVEGKNRGWEVIGFEPNKRARELSLSKGINLVDNLDEIDSHSVDVITMWHVLEHVVDLDTQLKQLQRILKKGGLLIIAVPNFKSYDASYYGKYWAAYDVPRHLWHFSQKSIPMLFRPYSFDLIGTHPMLFDSFYVSLLSEQYKTGRKNWFKAFRVGLKSNIEARQTSEYSSLIYILEKKQFLG
ncbi:class I SAM-dependent methyltransferase [Myroides pelagicus]|uniref:Methyltransferase domain-containing protein n=1 Tax=Myroides pelagicus TaxID=270914 RepID=A0A7K1GQR7_9FLAO|nr:class I SAM-dependent methyltransferase [Myroides pelagicus]MEC4113303.1 class I SAM-dependent methyltransferase [Myroides pelagicus]MTH30514.1 methyltransferase domain-containing protein [Myroides pelagicus]